MLHVSHYVGVDHGGLKLLVPQEALDLPDIGAMHQEMGREAVSLIPCTE